MKQEKKSLPPLIYTDGKKISSDDLNAEDALAKLKADNTKQAEKFKLVGQDELEDTAKGLGRPLVWHQFLLLLRKINPNLIFREGGCPNAVHISIADPKHPEAKPDGTRYVGGCMKEVLPEFGWVTVDEMGLPIDEKRGWRTVLLRLIHSKVVSKKKVDEVFGLALGQRSDRWYAQTRNY
jgi:hypothetical protein